MQLLGLPNSDPRDFYVGTTQKGQAYSYRKSTEGTRPVAQIRFVHGEHSFVVHLFQSDVNPQQWFKDLCWYINGQDELTGQIPPIRFLITKKSERGSNGLEGLNAIPSEYADQTPEMQKFLEAIPLLETIPQTAVEQELPSIPDQVKDFTEKEENRGKCDQRPRGRKDSELMTIVRVAAKRAGYEDDTPSASYSPFINAVLWQAAEEGLLFRVRHATINSKGGDVHCATDL
jgi:hypothetical protein